MTPFCYQSGNTQWVQNRAATNLKLHEKDSVRVSACGLQEVPSFPACCSERLATLTCHHRSQRFCTPCKGIWPGSENHQGPVSRSVLLDLCRQQNHVDSLLSPPAASPCSVSGSVSMECISDQCPGLPLETPCSHPLCPCPWPCMACWGGLLGQRDG